MTHEMMLANIIKKCNNAHNDACNDEHNDITEWCHIVMQIMMCM